MKFAKLSFEWGVSHQDFVNYWSAFYNYPKEDLYTERIGKNEFTTDDIEKLYVWKNGTPLSQKKKVPLKVITDKIGVVNRLKSAFDLELFKREFNGISAIWKIYLLHVIAPNAYPIFDQHVCRAFYFLTEHKLKEIPIKNSEKESFYFKNYVGFFNDLANGNIPRKKIDEALWALGKFLKTEHGKKIASP
jgi:hypothetical protein